MLTMLPPTQSFYPNPGRLLRVMRWIYYGLMLLIIGNIAECAWLDPYFTEDRTVQILLGRCAHPRTPLWGSPGLCVPHTGLKAPTLLVQTRALPPRVSPVLAL